MPPRLTPCRLLELPEEILINILSDLSVIRLMQLKRVNSVVRGLVLHVLPIVVGQMHKGASFEDAVLGPFVYEYNVDHRAIAEDRFKSVLTARGRHAACFADAIKGTLTCTWTYTPKEGGVWSIVQTGFATPIAFPEMPQSYANM